MKITSARQDQGIPGVYGLLLLDVVSRWGYNDETLFAPFHLTSEQLADPEYRISTPVANELVKHALNLTGESTLGYHIGTQMRISIHGFIGYAILQQKILQKRLLSLPVLSNYAYLFYNYIFLLSGQKPHYNCNVILS